MGKQAGSRKQRAAAGKPPEMAVRKVWTRKPHTQVVINKKAEQRRTFCRKGGTDGAVLCFQVYNVHSST
ncbi:hypothetical protein [Paenibacillus sp. 1P07SE]|uniref:hypothetical protein n=1 Tax=Paenibacillus sp. 1P07SE TaxID=3132209 RepID=UPI0039A42DFF